MFRFLKKKVLAPIPIPKLDLGSVPDTETWFQSHTNSIFSKISTSISEPTLTISDSNYDKDEYPGTAKCKIIFTYQRTQPQLPSLRHLMHRTFITSLTGKITLGMNFILLLKVKLS